MVVVSRSLIFMFVLNLFLLACETTLHEQRLPELTFAHLTPIKLNVAKINVEVQYKPTLRKPNVEHLFPTPPAEAIKQWAKDRLLPVGDFGEAKLIIIEASAIEKKLSQKEGFTAAFIRQQSHRYEAIVVARLEISSSLGQGSARAKVMRFTSVREDANINKRERAWFDLTEALARNFDVIIEKNIRQHLSQFLR